MEKKIKEYEKWIEKEAKKKGMTEKERSELFLYHSEMLRNFQAERLIHLIVMFFFVAATLGLLFLTMIGFSSDVSECLEMMIMVGVLDLLMIGLSVGYVRHYYFLENHIQGLYKWFEVIRKKE